MNEPLEGAPSRGSWEDIPSRLGARLEDLGAWSSRHGPIHTRDTLTFVFHSRLPVQSILFIPAINKVWYGIGPRIGGSWEMPLG